MNTHTFTDPQLLGFCAFWLVVGGCIGGLVVMALTCRDRAEVEP